MFGSGGASRLVALCMCQDGKPVVPGMLSRPVVSSCRTAGQMCWAEAAEHRCPVINCSLRQRYHLYVLASSAMQGVPGTGALLWASRPLEIANILL